MSEQITPEAVKDFFRHFDKPKKPSLENTNSSSESQKRDNHLREQIIADMSGSGSRSTPPRFGNSSPQERVTDSPKGTEIIKSSGSLLDDPEKSNTIQHYRENGSEGESKAAEEMLNGEAKGKTWQDYTQPAKETQNQSKDK